MNERNQDITDNTERGSHNWIQRIMSGAGQTAEHGPVENEVIPGDQSVRGVAELVGADFDLEYVPSGYLHPASGELVIPTYQRGKYKDEPADQYILRADTSVVVGNMSGRYPNREGYKHVFDTLDQLFPDSCRSVSVYGAGERVVVEQVMDEPYDLGDGDLIQPCIYTRMSLNGTWKTEIIPVSHRVSCENMLGHTGQLIGVRATRNHDHLLSMKADVVELAVAQGNTLRRMAQILSDEEFTNGMFWEMLERVLPSADADAHHKTRIAIGDRRNAVNSAWREERERGFNMWNAYNAFQGAEQHRINAGFKNTPKAKERALFKALDAKTPIADQAEQYLMGLVAVASGDEPF
jgi:hypothetical protein